MCIARTFITTPVPNPVNIHPVWKRVRFGMMIKGNGRGRKRPDKKGQQFIARFFP